jgi:hypothetical protein
MARAWGKTHVHKICALKLKGSERLGNLREAERTQVRHDFANFALPGFYMALEAL